MDVDTDSATVMTTSMNDEHAVLWCVRRIRNGTDYLISALKEAARCGGKSDSFVPKFGACLGPGAVALVVNPLCQDKDFAVLDHAASDACVHGVVNDVDNGS